MERFIKRRLFAVVAAVVLTVTLVVPAAAQTTDDATGSAEVTGGTLTMGALNESYAFSAVTLDGTDKTTTVDIPLDVNDATGSGTGWNLQVAATTFTTGTKSLADTGTLSITAVSAVCDATCTSPANSHSYPMALTTSATPTAVEFFDAAADTGMGDFTITPTLQVAIPANAYAGTYTSTFTITLASGPGA